MDLWKPSPIRLLLISLRTNARKTTTRFAARYSTFPSSRLPTRPDGLADIDHCARYIRATETPARDSTLAQAPKARLGADLFVKVGCDICHVQTLTTAPAGTTLNGDR